MTRRSIAKAKMIFATSTVMSIFLCSFFMVLSRKRSECTQTVKGLSLFILALLPVQSCSTLQHPWIRQANLWSLPCELSCPNYLPFSRIEKSDSGLSHSPNCREEQIQPVPSGKGQPSLVILTAWLNIQRKRILRQGLVLDKACTNRRENQS